MALQLKKNLSPRRNNNSNISLGNCTNPMPVDNINSSLHQSSISNSPNSSRITRQKLNLSHVDPKYVQGKYMSVCIINPINCIGRTYADVHSSGLTARIVQYQQESRGGLQRSVSFNNVCNPLSHSPRRSNIVRTPNRLPNKPNMTSLSITRIAPPEQSFYCGNTLPSLLRSNSVLGVEKVEQLSGENRPILHPQSAHHESEPTRSVLDELKEISRKRINSGVSSRWSKVQTSDFFNKHKFLQDLQQQDNTNGSKKSCNRMIDYVDHHLAHQHLAQQHHANHPYQYWPTIPAQTCFKRQRELSVAVPLRFQQQQLILQQQQQQHHQQLQQQQPHHLQLQQQKSPEQQAKRRNCNYSNDINSSLSSSRLHTNKRKLYDMQPRISPETSPRQQHAPKIQRKQASSDLRLEPLTHTQSMPITPLPATPAQRTISAPTLQEPMASPSSNKPKITLFNAQRQQQKTDEQQQLMQNQQEQQKQAQLDLDSPEVEASEYAGIQFVQPKLQNPIKGVRNSNLERMQKTKLASLLSSLKGEIYLGEETDEPDTTSKQKTSTAATVPSTATIATIVATPAQPISTATGTTTTTAPTKSTDTVTSAAETISTTKAAATPTNIAKPLMSFNQTTPTTSATSSKVGGFTTLITNISLTTRNNNTTTITNTTTTAKPLVFESVPKPATIAETTTVTVAPTITTSATTMFTFGNIASTAEPAVTTSAPATTATSAPIFSFGTATAVATPAPGTTTTSTDSKLFSFGSSATVTATPGAFTTTTTTTTTADKVFSFGNPPASSNSSAATAPTFTMTNWAPKPNSTPSIGGATATTPASTMAKAISSEPQKILSFGAQNVSASNENVTAAHVATPIFGTATTAVAASPVFSFGPATAAAADTASKSTAGATTAKGSPASAPIFSFGGDTKLAAKATPFTLPSSGNNVFSFGGTGDGTKTTAPAPANSFSFNATTAAAPTVATPNAFSFTTAPPKQTPIFGGSGTNSNNTAANKPFTFGGLASQDQQQQQASHAGQPRSGGFSFAAAAQKNESSNLFATPAVAKPSFNFGGNATSTIPAATSSATAAGVPAPAFGGFAAPAAPAGKPFTFGGNAPQATNSAAAGTAQSAAPMGGNIFASAVAAVQQQPKPTSFSFGSTNNNANNSSGANSINAPFSFGGISSTPQSSNTAKPFAFGGTATPSAQAGNIFGSPAAPQATPIPSTNGGAFNFGGAAKGAPSTPQQLNSGNVFAPPSTPENRPMRRATRRLQK